MPLRNAHPIRFSATGVCDALDSTDVPGAMASLVNLIPDPTTKGLFQCRPAAVSLSTFAGFTTPGFVSLSKVFGTRVYGMVASGRFPGHDEPFCYDLAASAFVTISGVTSANTPISPSTSGTWTPPTCDMVGPKVLFTHPGFTAASGNYIGFLDVSTPSAPVWSAGNLTTNALPAVPVAVVQFGNRAYYLVNPVGSASGVYASDVLVPDKMTNINVINFDDQVPCTAMAGLPLNNQQGGIIQAIMVFKGATNIYQITGDPSLSNWTRNTVNVATGTLSPRSIAITPQGLAFVAPDGLRMISFTGQVGPPLGEGGSGVVAPFENAAEPTRICAAANGGVLRISVKNSASVWQEYWFDLTRQLWTGPHTFPFTSLSVSGNTFVGAPQAVQASLWQSDYLQSTASVFTENGSALTWTWQTAMLPDNQVMAEMTMVETTLHMALQANSGSPPLVSIYALDQNGTQLGSYSISVTGPTWGSSSWGSFTWGGISNNLFPRQAIWPTPITFRRLAVKASGPSVRPLKVGDLYLRYQQLGYLQQ